MDTTNNAHSNDRILIVYVDILSNAIVCTAQEGRQPFDLSDLHWRNPYSPERYQIPRGAIIEIEMPDLNSKHKLSSIISGSG